MKKNIETLMQYFSKTYNLKKKTDRYRYVAEELGVTPKTIWNALNQKTNNPILEKLSKKVVDDFRTKGLIK